MGYANSVFGILRLLFMNMLEIIQGIRLMDFLSIHFLFVSPLTNYSGIFFQLKG